MPDTGASSSAQHPDGRGVKRRRLVGKQAAPERQGKVEEASMQVRAKGLTRGFITN